MKRYIWMGALAACMLGACGGHEEHDHDHEAEAEAKEAHAAHSDEIILTPEKAKAAGVKVEEVQPGTFRSVIATSGQILAAQGDEATVVASVSGVVKRPSVNTNVLPNWWTSRLFRRKISVC